MGFSSTVDYFRAPLSLRGRMKPLACFTPSLLLIFTVDVEFAGIVDASESFATESWPLAKSMPKSVSAIRFRRRVVGFCCGGIVVCRIMIVCVTCCD